MSEEQSTASLAGTTPQARAELMRFGSGGGKCSATYGDHWTGEVCGEASRWYVGVEDAQAGMTDNGYFHPAHTYTRVCDKHLALLRAEPRLILRLEEVDPSSRSSG